MKKIILLIITVFLLSAPVFADSLKVTNIEAPKTLGGNEFFPLFVGAKWKWATEGYGNIKEINWEIASAHKVTYETKAVKDITAYKLRSKEFFEEWYVVELEGYICFLNEFSDELIEKKIPLQPKAGDQWNNGNITYKISELTQDSIKIVYKDDKNIIDGYEIYKKGSGPYQKSEVVNANGEKKSFVMTMNEYIDYKTVIKTDDAIVKKEDFVDEELKTVENKKDEIKKEELKPEEIKEVKPEEKKEEIKIDEIKPDEKKKEVNKEEVKKEEVKKEEIKKEEVKKDDKPRIDDVVIDSKLYRIDENDIIANLNSDKFYIQIGAFNVPYYANILLKTARDEGFLAKIYRDKDGFYKVLIVTNNDPLKIIDEVKRKVSKDAFVKKKK